VEGRRTVRASGFPNLVKALERERKAGYPAIAKGREVQRVAGFPSLVQAREDFREQGFPNLEKGRETSRKGGLQNLVKGRATRAVNRRVKKESGFEGVRETRIRKSAEKKANRDAQLEARLPDDEAQRNRYGHNPTHTNSIRISRHIATILQPKPRSCKLISDVLSSNVLVKQSGPETQCLQHILRTSIRTRCLS